MLRIATDARHSSVTVSQNNRLQRDAFWSPRCVRLPLVDMVETELRQELLFSFWREFGP